MDMNTAQALRAMHLEQLAFEHTVTLSHLDAAPEDKLTFSPHEKSRPFHEIVHHIYDSGPFFASALEQGKVSFEAPPPFTVPTTKAALREACQRLHDDYLRRIGALSGDKLTAMIPFGSMPPLPGVSYLGWHANHLIHHRGQLSVYLRLMGAKVPSTYGGSADVPFQM
jgi:uncharacterized damage-inducible protein DinB